MKKIILSIAIIASLMTFSCKESTKDKVEDATEAVGDDIESGVEDAAEKVDSTATEVGNDVKDAVKEGAEKVEEKANEVKKSM